MLCVFFVKFISDLKEVGVFFHLFDKGFRLNRILYEMAVFGLDELECDDTQDLEVINMFKDYYAEILRLNDESSSIE